MPRIIILTFILITLLISFLTGYFINSLKEQKVINKKLITDTNRFILPISPNETGISRTSIYYSIEGVIESISSDSSILKIKTDKILGPYSLGKEVDIRRTSNMTQKLSRGVLKNGMNVRINYVFEWVNHKTESYITSILIK